MPVVTVNFVACNRLLPDTARASATLQQLYSLSEPVPPTLEAVLFCRSYFGGTVLTFESWGTRGHSAGISREVVTLQCWRYGSLGLSFCVCTACKAVTECCVVLLLL